MVWVVVAVAVWVVVAVVVGVAVAVAVAVVVVVAVAVAVAVAVGVVIEIMKLRDLIVITEDRTLPKEKLEDYYSSVCELEAKIHAELADIEQEEAIYLDESQETTHARKVEKWNVTEKGLRGIMLRRYLKSAEKLERSIKQRIYAML